MKVGLEPFPPVINQDGSGIAISLLLAVSQQTNLDFDIELMTYDRAKKALFNGKLDLIGLTPKGEESPEFYQHADELLWSFETTVDVFSPNRQLLSLENIANKSIGTLIGNADFIAQITQIPREKFVEVSNLEQLVVMMTKGRIKQAIFERVSMMTTITRLGLPRIHYQKLMNLPASFAVRKTQAGKKLKTQLDAALKTLDTDVYLEHMYHYNRLADSGVVSTFADKKTLN